MADDQKTKTMDINDLVRELSKSATSPVTPTPSPQAPRPSFPTLPIQPKQSLDAESRTLDSSAKSNVDLGRIGAKPPMPSSSGGSMINPPSVTPVQPKPPMPKPQFNVPPQPFSQPKPTLITPPSPTTQTPPTPGVKEYQSSIRTMNEDISKIKQGQQPMGVPVPRKVEQVVPVAPSPTPAKPVMPSPQFKVPSINLGEAQKTGPLAQSKDFSKSTIAPKTEPKPQIFVPQEGQPGGNRNMLFLGIGAVAIVAGFAYWFFVLRLPAPEIVIETPTPSQTPIATPVWDLVNIFSDGAIQGIGVVPDSLISDFNGTIDGGTEEISVQGGQFINLKVSSETKDYSQLWLMDFLLKPDQGLVDNLGIERKIFLYGQKETFDSKGQLGTNTSVGKRLVFVSEVKNGTTATQLAQAWETTLSSDLKVLFSLGTANKSNPGFLDNFYRGVNIRYSNFPYPDKTIDYAIVSAQNGKTYFVVTNSRESIISAIDKLVTQ